MLIVFNLYSKKLLNNFRLKINYNTLYESINIFTVTENIYFNLN